VYLPRNLETADGETIWFVPTAHKLPVEANRAFR
jgi:hypothetical protein